MKSKIMKIVKFVGNIAHKLGIKSELILLHDKWLNRLRTFQMYILRPFDLKFKYTHMLDIMSIEETIEYIVENRCSVSRYGDGEFNMLSNNSIGFQSASPELVDKLRKTVKVDHLTNCLICLPGIFNYENEYEKTTQKFWNKILVHKRKEWYGYCNLDYKYGNADITRCYIELKDRTKSSQYFEMLKLIWNERKVIIVEGEKSRLGIGNDLFSNTDSIHRILCPAIGAYSSYDKIVEYIKSHIERDNLLLLALGPTASVMAVELAQEGYQAIDIGNIDKEYEWWQAKTDRKVVNPIKFTMEVANGTNVQECTDIKYLNEILCKIGCDKQKDYDTEK